MPKIKNIQNKTSLDSFAQDQRAFSAGPSAAKRKKRKDKLPIVTGPPDPVSGATGDLDSQVEAFRFLECDPISINGAEPVECPVCRPNPNAYVPDYTLMTPGNTYFDGKTCTYCYMLEIAAPQNGGHTVSELKNPTKKQEDIKRIGIKNLLEYHNKASVATVYYYEKEDYKTDTTTEAVTILGSTATGAAIGLAGSPIGAVIGASIGLIVGIGAAIAVPDPVPGYVLRAEQRDVVEELLDYTEIRYTVPIQLKARTKIAVCIDAEAWSRVPTKLVTDPDTPFETDYEVTFTGEDFEPMFKRAAGDSFLGLYLYAGGFRLYQKQLEKWRNLEGGMLKTIDGNKSAILDLEFEAEMLLHFRDNVMEIIDEATGLSMTDLEKITFKFEPYDSSSNETGIEDPDVKIRPETEDPTTVTSPKIRLKQMIFNKPGCPEIIFSNEDEEGKGFFRKLIGKSPFKASRSLYYVGALPDMDKDLTAGEPVPWLEFVLKYTYPMLQVSYDSDNLNLFNDPSLGACLADSLLDEEGVIGAMMEALGAELSALPDAILGGLAENLCLTQEQMEEKDFKLSEKMSEDVSKTWEESKSEIGKGDPYLDSVFIYLESILKKKKSPDETMGTIWDTLMSRLGYCGWIALIMKALDCLMQGMDQESFMKATVEAWLLEANDYVLQGVIAGLPQEDKDRIQALSDERYANLPPPWDTMAYQIGSYNSPGMTTSETYEAIMAGETGAGEGADAVQSETAQDDWSEQYKEDAEYTKSESTIQNEYGTKYNDLLAANALIAADSPAKEASDNALKALEKEYEDALYDLKYPPADQASALEGDEKFWGIAYSPETDDFSFGEGSVGAGGTYGEAMGDVQKEVFDAYRNLLLDAVGVDVLFGMISKAPGGGIIGQFFKTIPCKLPPPWTFDPQLDSFLNTLEFDMCQIAGGKVFDITMPHLADRWRLSDFNLHKQLWNAVEIAMKKAVVAIVVAMLKGLINSLLNAACDALKMLGANLADLYEGSDHFRNLLLENLCPDASADQLNESMKNFFAALGGPDSDCLTLLSNGEMGEYIDDISLMLTQEQVMQLLQGNATPETLALAAETARISTSECIRYIFSDPAAIAQFFRSLNIFVPANAFERYIPDLPVSPCPPGTYARIEDIKCGLLSKKGLSKKECREELDKLKDKSIQDLQALINMLMNGPLADFPPVQSSAECPVDGFYPNNPGPVDGQANSSVSALLLSPIETGVIKDLMDSDGVLNNILADTEGRRWSAHNAKVRWFGAPLARQMGIFGWNCDDSIKNPDGGGSVDQFGNTLSGQDAGTQSWIINLGAGAQGGFPPTVGAWMAKKFRSMNPEFKTAIIPSGYSSLAAAKADVEEKEAINAERIEARQKYVSAFIKQYGLDSVNATSDSAELSGMLRRACYSVRVFEKGAQAHTVSEVDDNEVSESVYLLEQLLLGNAFDCCGFWKRSAEFSSSEASPSSWSDSSQELARTEGKRFIDYYPSSDFKLIDVPDIMTPDLSLSYSSHDTNDEGEPTFSFNLAYDYNLPDKDGFIGKRNDYTIRIKVTTASPPEEDEYAEGQFSDPIITGKAYSWTDYSFKVEANLDKDTRRYINELPMSNHVNDSWQAEVFYRMISKSIIDASSNKSETSTALAADSVRAYFSTSGDGKKFDDITSGFFRRLANRISTGRSFANPNIDIDDSDADEAGFLEPDVSNIVSDDVPSDPVMANIATGFSYGYNQDGPEIIFLDNETYGGPLGRLFPDLVPPPFYVAPPKYTGWKEIAEAFVPSPDGCDPARGPLFTLGDLEQKASQLTSKLEQDERFSQDPLCTQEAPYDKIFENSTIANIDIVLRAATRVYITEAFMRAVPIISQFEFNEDNVESGIVEFIVERIKRGLEPDGVSKWLWFNDKTNDDDYYYRFIEQAFNVVSKKVDSKILDPEKDFNSEEKRAYNTIKTKIAEFYEKNDGDLAALSFSAIKNQSFMKDMFDNTATAKFGGLGAGSSDFSKSAAEKAKEYAFELMIDETIDSALVFVKRMVREEIPIVGNMFNSKLYPPIKNIDHLFLLSPAWIRGAVNGGGPLDVTSDPTKANKYNIPSGQHTSISDAISELQSSGLTDLASSFETAYGGMSEWPFVLEKYVRIIDQESVPAEVANRSENLYDIVNMSDWKTYVQRIKSQGVTGKISEFFGKTPMTGETHRASGGHVHEYEVDEEGNGFAFRVCHDKDSLDCHVHRIINWKVKEADGHEHDLPMPACRFGLRLCYLPEADESNTFRPIISTMGKEARMREKAYELASPEGSRFLIPIASAELEIPDQEFSSFDPESYDVYCLIPELIKSAEYKSLFRYVFPFHRFLSLLTIYCMQGFYDSLGNEGWPDQGGDMWENRGGNFWSSFSGWERADEQVFSNSREAAKNALNALYETTQAEYSSETSSKAAALSFAELLKPKLNFEDGLRWWQRGKRIKNSPFNMDGDNCK